MIRAEQSVEVPRDPATVFAFLDEPSNASRWMAMCTRLEQTSPPPKRVGTTLRYAHNQGPGGGTMDGVVTRYKPGERIEMQLTDKMFDVAISFAVKPSGTGSKVTIASEITPKGFLAKMMSSTIAKAAEGQMAKDVAKLKELLSS